MTLGIGKVRIIGEVPGDLKRVRGAPATSWRALWVWG